MNFDTMNIGNPILRNSKKLLPCQKEMIFYWFRQGESFRKIAKRFKVSGKCVELTLYPERRWKSAQPYNGKKAVEAVQRCRARKKKLFNKKP